MAMKVSFFWAAFVCVLQLVSAVQDECSDECIKKIDEVLYEDKKITPKKDLVDACTFACRMVRIDEVLSWPSSTNLTTCREYCVEAYRGLLPEIRSCIIGCNITAGAATEISPPSNDSISDSLSTPTETPEEDVFMLEIVTYFTSPIMKLSTMLLFSIDEDTGDTEVMVYNNQQPIQAVSSNKSRSNEFLSLLIFGGNDAQTSNLLIDEQETPTQSLVRSYYEKCVWPSLQLLCFILLLGSLAFCVYLFTSDEDSKQEHTKQKCKPILNPFMTPVQVYTVPVKMDGDKKLPLP